MTALIGAGCSLLGTGCSALRPSTRDLAAEIAFWDPHLLLSAPDPYPSLFVEVDAVEGAVPDPGYLDELRAFLEEQVDKPAGVRVVLDDIIPKAVARGRNSQSLALEYIDGADDEAAASIYLFYYDSGTMPDRRSRPATTLLPYPVSIFIDTAYTFIDTEYAADSSRGTAEFGKLALRHEAGHVLGLSRNASHSDGIHCTHADCIMGARLALDISKLLTRHDPWRQREFCIDCLADLRAHRQARPADNLRFMGPFLVRSEPGYQVLSLPGLVYVQVGALEDLDPDLLREFRAEAVRHGRRGQVMYSSSVVEAGVAREIFPGLMSDPLDAVRKVGQGLQRKLGAVPGETRGVP